jgi:hypothetical protein
MAFEQEIAALRRQVDQLPATVTAQLRAVAWRYSRKLHDRSKALLLARIHGHNTANHQRTADSFVIHEDAPNKQFWVGVENPDNPNLDLWIEKGTRFISARPHWRPASDELTAPYQREMAAAAEAVIKQALGGE